MPTVARIPDPAQAADLSARLAAAGPTALDDSEALQLLAGLGEAQAAMLILAAWRRRPPTGVAS